MKDPGRRGVGSQLSLQESRHRLARKIFYGHRGEPLRQAYREGQEDQLGALGLVLNAVVLWNTRYLDAAPSKLRASGYPVLDENVARLSPLGDPHTQIAVGLEQLVILTRVTFGLGPFIAAVSSGHLFRCGRCSVRE